MSTARFLRLSFLATSLAASASAQLEHDLTIPWTSGLGAANALNRAVAVDASGDGRLDLFVRGGTDNSRIFFFDNVWGGGGGLATGIACNDFAAAPGQGPDGIGALAFVDAAGLKLLVRNELKIDEPSTLEFQAPTLIAADHWTGALRVRVGDLDNAGSPDYAGVRDDGRSIIVRLGGASSDVEFDIGRDVLDIAILQWNASPAREIAVLTNLGVEIRSGAGAVIDAVPVAGHTSRAFAVLPVPGDKDRLAWLGTEGTSGPAKFALLKRVAPKVENLVVLDASDQTAVGLATGDIDGDGETDVVVTRTSTPLPWVLFNLAPSTPWFDPQDTQCKTVPSGWTTSQTAVGQPVLARFANGARAELVLPAHSSNSAELALFHQPSYGLTSADVFLFDATQNDPDVRFDAPTTPAERVLAFTLNFGTEVLAPPSGTEDRRLEFLMWKGVGGGNVSTLIDKRYWINWPSSVEDTDLRIAGLTVAMEEGSNSTACDFIPRFIEVRQIRVTTNGAITESGPAYGFGIVRAMEDVSVYPPWGPEGADLIDGSTMDHFTCEVPGPEGAIHARAIVRRRPPNPVAGQPPTYPVVNTTGATATHN